MKFRWDILQGVAVAVLGVFLFSFANARNEQRVVANTAIAFSDESTPYITRQEVSNLLKSDGYLLPKEQTFEKLDIEKLELMLDTHAVIKNADIFAMPDGKLKVSVTQHQPIARVLGDKNFYLAKDGAMMPLSSNYSARVPIVSGVDKQDLEQVWKLITFINSDPFLTMHVTGVVKQKNGDYMLTIRTQQYQINIGKIEGLKAKFNNYAAFYKKAQKENRLQQYKIVSLKFNNQVVGQKIA